jgi:tetratricopeptide (TPR) repeat protein
MSTGLRQRKGGGEEASSEGGGVAAQLAAFYTKQGDATKAKGAAAMLAKYGQPSVAAALYKKFGVVPDGWAAPAAPSGGGCSCARMLAIVVLMAAAVFGGFGAAGLPVPKELRAMQEMVEAAVAKAMPPPAADSVAAAAGAGTAAAEQQPEPEPEEGSKLSTEETTKQRIALSKHNYAINAAVQIINMAAALSDRNEALTMFGEAEKNLLVPIKGAMEGNERQQYLAHSTLATVLHSYFHESRAEEAKEHYSAAAALDDSEPELLFHYGTLLYKMGKATEAADQFLKSVAREGVGKASAATRHNLALAYAMMDKDAESDAMYAQAKDIDPELSGSVGITKLAGDITQDK